MKKKWVEDKEISIHNIIYDLGKRDISYDEGTVELVNKMQKELEIFGGIISREFPDVKIAEFIRRLLEDRGIETLGN